MRRKIRKVTILTTVSFSVLVFFPLVAQSTPLAAAAALVLTYKVLKSKYSCSGCPQVRPDFNTDCMDGQEGLDCDYGEQECCGEKFPEIKMECRSNQWQGYYVDTICMIGGNNYS